MRLYQVLHDGEAEAGATLLSRAGGVGAPESLEDPGEVLARNSHPGVADTDGCALTLTPGGAEDPPAGGGIAERVVEEIGEDLP